MGVSSWWVSSRRRDTLSLQRCVRGHGAGADADPGSAAGGRLLFDEFAFDMIWISSLGHEAAVQHQVEAQAELLRVIWLLATLSRRLTSDSRSADT